MSDGDNEWNLIVLITFYMPISFIHWAWLESGLDDDVNNNSQPARLTGLDDARYSRCQSDNEAGIKTHQPLSCN